MVISTITTVAVPAKAMVVDRGSIKGAQRVESHDIAGILIKAFLASLDPNVGLSKDVVTVIHQLMDW